MALFDQNNFRLSKTGLHMVWQACVLHGYCKISGHFSHLRVEMLSRMVALCAICAIGQSMSLVVVNVICVLLASLHIAHLLQNI